MVQGITFDKQLLASEDFAHQVNYFYQGKMGVSKGCEVSADVSGNLVISDGYFSIYGRLLKNVGDTAVEVPSVPSGTLYSSLVFEVDLTKENTIDAFNQGQFKIVSSADTYPALIQENLDNGGNIYQLEFAKFENTVAGIINLQDTRTILSMQMYTPQDEFNTHLADYVSKFPDNAGAHNSIFRGDNLGSAPDYVNIANNTFENMYIGDYFTVNGRIYDIAHINYYIDTGDTALTTPHLVLVPREPLYGHAMNDTNITEGGYMGSKMYIQGLTQAITTIKADFPNHVLSHRRYLSNATTDGEASAGAWVDREVDLMNEIMVYGSGVNGAAIYGLYNVGVDKSQLALFRLRPDLIGIRFSWWLRDVASASDFAHVDRAGYARHGYASDSYGVRPGFLIS